MSSGEAELYGVVRGGAVGLGFISLLSDLGVRLPLRLWTDSTASKGMCSRQGLGKVRHLDTQELWVQQRIRNGDFALYKVEGEEDPGDLFTKAGLSYHRIKSLLTSLGCEYREGRPAAAPAFRQKEKIEIFEPTPAMKPKGEYRRRGRWADEVEDEYNVVHGEDAVSYTHLTLPTKRIV